MTNKELSQLYWLNREIWADKRRLAELKTAAEGRTARITGLPHIGGAGRGMEAYAILIAEQSALIEGKIRRCVEEYTRLNRYIEQIEDSLIRQIMSLRHVNGFEWDQVAAHIGGKNTADSVRMAHNRFLRTQ